MKVWVVETVGKNSDDDWIAQNVYDSEEKATNRKFELEISGQYGHVLITCYDVE